MTAKLTREKVIAEIEELAHQAVSLEARIQTLSNAGFVVERAEFDEWLAEIAAAKRLTVHNQMDFREVDAALLGLRQSRSSFDGAMSDAELRIKPIPC